MTPEEIELWNTSEIALVHALLGAVSSNFRAVWLDKRRTQWLLKFILETESASDRLAIEDVGQEFEAVQKLPLSYDIEVEVTDQPIAWPSPPARVVFYRRELGPPLEGDRHIFQRGVQYRLKVDMLIGAEVIHAGELVEFRRDGYATYEDSYVYNFLVKNSNRTLSWAVHENEPTDRWVEFFEREL